MQGGSNELLESVSDAANVFSRPSGFLNLQEVLDIFPDFRVIIKVLRYGCFTEEDAHRLISALNFKLQSWARQDPVDLATSLEAAALLDGSFHQHDLPDKLHRLRRVLAEAVRELQVLYAWSKRQLDKMAGLSRGTQLHDAIMKLRGDSTDWLVEDAGLVTATDDQGVPTSFTYAGLSSTHAAAAHHEVFAVTCMSNQSHMHAAGTNPIIWILSRASFSLHLLLRGLAHHLACTTPQLQEKGALLSSLGMVLRLVTWARFYKELSWQSLTCCMPHCTPAGLPRPYTGAPSLTAAGFSPEQQATLLAGGEAAQQFIHTAWALVYQAGDLARVIIDIRLRQVINDTLAPNLDVCRQQLLQLEQQQPPNPLQQLSRSSSSMVQDLRMMPSRWTWPRTWRRRSICV